MLWVGHATTLIQTPHLNMITDPILFGSIGGRTVRHQDRDESRPDHRESADDRPHPDQPRSAFDHLDLRSLHALIDRQLEPRRQESWLAAAFENILKDAGISSYQELDWDDSVSIKDARRCTSWRPGTRPEGGSQDTDKTLWGSFLIDSPDGRIYFGGDSGYGAHTSRRIYEKFGRASRQPAADWRV